MLETSRLVALALLWLFLAGASWAARRYGGRDRTGLFALVVGVVAARAGYVWINAPAFADAPADVLKIWQGGFSAGVGVAAAAAYLVFSLRRSSALLPTLGALAATAALWLGYATLQSRPAAKPLPSHLMLASLDGRSYDLASLRGRPFIINLWATWCPPCRREMPVLVDVARQNPGTPIVLINQGESADKINEFLRAQGLGAPHILRDPTASFGRELGSAALPTTLFVGADQAIHHTHMGEISRAALLSGLRDLDTGDPK